MTLSLNTIGLCMIVKNEAPVIRRCLASVRPLLSHWLIVDTGSTDGTQGIVREAMAGLPGGLVERPWVDFAHNRTEALTLARRLADYSLVIDADDELLLPADFALPHLAADSYDFEIVDAGMTDRCKQLVSNRLAWRYRGVLHEFLEGPGEATTGELPIAMRRNHDGARRRDPETYRRDAAVLERALAAESDPVLISRYTFYLAQCLRDCGDREGAIEVYLRRAELGHWHEEVYLSLLYAGRLMQEEGHVVEEALAVLARAMAVCPHRAEAVHAASLACRLNGLNARGCDIAEPALDLRPPAAGFRVEPWIYAYGLRDEFAVNAYWARRYDSSLAQTLSALAAESLPERERARLLANARSAAEGLAKGVMSWPEDAPVPAPHRLLATRAARPAPRVLIALLAKQKAPVLPFFLDRLGALDYPKDRIVLYVRTNNNTDDTRAILRAWCDRHGGDYAGIDFDDRDLPTCIETMAVHDWNVTRLRIIRALREITLHKALEHRCDFLMSVDVDNFVVPSTLRELVALDLPIVAPLIREAGAGARYANFSARIDAAGYFLETPRYDEILYRRITGLIELPVVHCTYLVRADVIPRLSYQDGSERFDYVVFSDSARRAGVPQYLDNRQLYGYLTLNDDRPAIIAEQLATLRMWFAGSGVEPAYA